MDMAKTDKDMAISYTIEENALSSQGQKMAKKLLNGCHEHMDEIDQTIEAISSSWKLSRMCSVDRNILRLATYELMHTTVPVGVVINEAVELSKRFDDEKSRKFINGILGSLAEN